MIERERERGGERESSGEWGTGKGNAFFIAEREKCDLGLTRRRHDDDDGDKPAMGTRGLAAFFWRGARKREEEGRQQRLARGDGGREGGERVRVGGIEGAAEPTAGQAVRGRWESLLLLSLLLPVRRNQKAGWMGIDFHRQRQSKNASRGEGREKQERGTGVGRTGAWGQGRAAAAAAAAQAHTCRSSVF